MADYDFKIGTVVYLESGGPPMTVIEIPKAGFIKTCWIGDDGVSATLTLPSAAVKMRINSFKPVGPVLSYLTLNEPKTAESSAAAASNLREICGND